GRVAGVSDFYRRNVARARRAEWPQADYITGNPPFIGTKRMIDALGVGYAEALRKAWKGSVPESADFVMFWWQKAAELVRDGKARKFGFITTNSIHQTFNRRVIEPFLTATKKPLHLAYAIPDHPWIDSADGAAVRIAMTVAAPGHAEGLLEKVVSERAREDGENEVILIRSEGMLAPNLQIGADLGSTVALASNDKVAGMGVALHGSGFILQPEDAKAFRASGPRAIKAYLGGADLLRNPRERYLIDFSFMTEAEALTLNPAAYQHVLNHVKPERDQNRRAALKDNWWKFGWERPVLRKALVGLSRFIGTTETSKHRVFQFIPVTTLADHMIVCFALDDAFILGILSSDVHAIWVLARGGTLEDRPRYNKTVCFDPFSFPALEEGELKYHIRDLGERLDAHRKRQQELHPDITLTGLYNVLDKLRSGEALTAKDKEIHDKGLVSILKQIHDDLDAAVLEAYGWTDLASVIPIADILARGGPDAEALEQQLLTRLVALNHERAAEEKRGLIRWLRPDYQAPGAVTTQQTEISLPADDEAIQATASHGGPGRSALPDWPAELPAQVAALRKLLPTVGHDPERLAACFGRKSQKRTAQISGILDTLRALGHIN
ncbi:MAG: DNA methyltransferase, partial [Verrucomicrobiota bacterium]